MVRRGWRDLLYLNNATAEAKASGFLYLEKAALSGTIENVGASSACTEAGKRVFGDKRPPCQGSSDPRRVSSVGDRRSVATMRKIFVCL